MLISPNSLITTAVRAIAGSRNARFSSVVLPLPRKPVNKVTGVLMSSRSVTRPSVAAFGCVTRSEEHTSELQSLMRISYAVFCLKKKTDAKQQEDRQHTHRTSLK